LAAGIAVLVLALGTFAPPWISARLTSSALRHRNSAAADLRWARRLDPLAVDPWLARATLARSDAVAVSAMEAAVRKEPRASGLRYLLGLAYLKAEDSRNARRSLELAHRLDPRDKDIALALQRARATD
jgi:Flp pilus assembly protein TadD